MKFTDRKTGSTGDGDRPGASRLTCPREDQRNSAVNTVYTPPHHPHHRSSRTESGRSARPEPAGRSGSTHTSSERRHGPETGPPGIASERERSASPPRRGTETKARRSCITSAAAAGHGPGSSASRQDHSGCRDTGAERLVPMQVVQNEKDPVKVSLERGHYSGNNLLSRDAVSSASRA